MLANIWRSTRISQRSTVRLFKNKIRTVIIQMRDVDCVKDRNQKNPSICKDKPKETLKNCLAPKKLLIQTYRRAGQMQDNIDIKRPWGWIGHTARKANEDV